MSQVNRDARHAKRAGEWVDRLEERSLMSAFAADINFQPAAVATPAGYVADSGAVLADRGNGLTYGWNGPRPAAVTARKLKHPTADVLQSTFATMHFKGRGSQWTLDLPNGDYTVSLTAGDPTATGWERIDVNGLAFIDAKATRLNRFITNTQMITVTDGTLALTVPRGAVSKIDCLTVLQVPPTETTPTSSTPPTSSTTSTGSTSQTAGAGSSGASSVGASSGGASSAGASGSDGSTGSTAPGSTTSSPGSTGSDSGTPSASGSGSASSGGYGAGSGSTTTTPQPLTLKWTQVASSPVGRLEASSVVIGGNLYVMGGYGEQSPNWLATKEFDRYTPATNSWTRLADMPEGLTHIGVATDGRCIYAAGGYVSNYKTGWQTFATADTWRYDTRTNAWSAFVPLPSARSAGYMVILNDKLYYYDGNDIKRNPTTNTWVLNLASANPAWTSLAPVPTSENHITGCVLNGLIYAIGGQPGNDDGSPSALCFVYNPATNVWSKIANLPGARSHAVAAALDGQIVLVGGVGSYFTPLASVVAYNPATSKWSTVLASLPAKRENPTGEVVNGQLVITTGYYNGTLETQTWITQPFSS